MTINHYDVGDWVDYARGLVGEAARKQMSAHLTDCSACETTAVTFGQLATMREPLEPPERAVAHALNIFRQPHPAVGASIQPRKLRPRILYDTMLAGSPAGTRRAGAETRRQLFEVGGYFLDLDIAVQAGSAGPAQLMLVGQLVDRSEPGRALSEFLVWLEGRRGPIAQAESNAMGEFELLGDARAAVRLAITLEDVEIELELPRPEEPDGEVGGVGA